MTKIKLLSICCAVLLVANVALLVFVFMAHKPPPKEGRNRNIIIEALHFDKIQITRYDALIKIHQQETKKKVDQINKARTKLYKLLNRKENVVDKATLLSEIARAQTDLEQINFAHFLAIKSICKPNQLNDYSTLTDRLAEMFDKGSKNGAPRNGGR